MLVLCCWCVGLRVGASVADGVSVSGGIGAGVSVGFGVGFLLCWAVLRRVCCHQSTSKTACHTCSWDHLYTGNLVQPVVFSVIVLCPGFRILANFFLKQRKGVFWPMKRGQDRYYKRNDLVPGLITRVYICSYVHFVTFIMKKLHATCSGYPDKPIFPMF